MSGRSALEWKFCGPTSSPCRGLGRLVRDGPHHSSGVEKRLPLAASVCASTERRTCRFVHVSFSGDSLSREGLQTCKQTSCHDRYCRSSATANVATGPWISFFEFGTSYKTMLAQARSSLVCRVCSHWPPHESAARLQFACRDSDRRFRELFRV